MASSFLALILFAILSLVYFIIKYFMYSSSQMKIVTGIYFLLVIVTQYIVSLSAIKEKCGNNDYVSAFMTTAFPWTFIFGILYIVMTMFPAWKAPFANTCGYGFARLAGVRTLLVDDILKKDAYKQGGGGMRKMFKRSAQRGGGGEEVEDSGLSSVKDMTKAIQNIYSDPSMLINEITIDNYETFWSRMKPLFKSSANVHKDALFKMILLKDVVAECIWYLLTGMLVTSMVANSIVNTKCRYSIDEMKKNQDESDRAINTAAETKEEPRVYSTKE